MRRLPRHKCPPCLPRDQSMCPPRELARRLRIRVQTARRRAVVGAMEKALPSTHPYRASPAPPAWKRTSRAFPFPSCHESPVVVKWNRNAGPREDITLCDHVAGHVWRHEVSAASRALSCGLTRDVKPLTSTAITVRHETKIVSRRGYTFATPDPRLGFHPGHHGTRNRRNHQHVCTFAASVPEYAGHQASELCWIRQPRRVPMAKSRSSGLH